MAGKYLFIGVVFGAFYYGLGEASYCYVCNSLWDTGCHDPFQFAKSYNCNTLIYDRKSIDVASDQAWLPIFDYIAGNYQNTTNITYGCLKLDLKYPNGTQGITRTCLPRTGSDSCGSVDKSHVGADIDECNFCQHLLCNSASLLRLSYVLVIFVFFRALS